MGPAPPSPRPPHVPLSPPCLPLCPHLGELGAEPPLAISLPGCRVQVCGEMGGSWGGSMGAEGGYGGLTPPPRVSGWGDPLVLMGVSGWGGPIGADGCYGGVPPPQGVRLGGPWLLMREAVGTGGGSCGDPWVLMGVMGVSHPPRVSVSGSPSVLMGISPPPRCQGGGPIGADGGYRGDTPGYQPGGDAQWCHPWVPGEAGGGTGGSHLNDKARIPRTWRSCQWRGNRCPPAPGPPHPPWGGSSCTGGHRPGRGTRGGHSGRAHTPCPPRYPPCPPVPGWSRYAPARWPQTTAGT